MAINNENNFTHNNTIPSIYLERIKTSSKKTAFITSHGDKTEKLKWEEVDKKIKAIFFYLRNQNLKRKDCVAIISQSRPEWIIFDIAIQCAGLITVPIYPSNTIEDISYILDHSECKLVFAEDDIQYEKLQQVFLKIGRKITTVIINSIHSSPDGATLLKDIISIFPTTNLEKDLEDSIKSISEEDTFSIVYTSGTTGVPKGVVLTQKNIVSELKSVIYKIGITHKDVSVTFLPFAHILGRIESLAFVMAGFTMGFSENINKLPEAILQIKPTILVSVPRIYEKIFIKIKSTIETTKPSKLKIFNWAVGIGRKIAKLRSINEKPNLKLLLQYFIANKLVFSKIREKMGGRLRLTISGGAPLNPELCEFFHACGIKILEGYGLTETTAAAAVNLPNDYGFGTVGRPIDGVEIKIAEDGEILIRGNVVFKEYFKDVETTKSAFIDGWFLTGDIGYINEKGHLIITDRKKDIIVTSGGKNVAPQKIENMLKSTRFISQAMVYGDKKKYLISLITLNEQEILEWAKHKGLKFNSLQDLIFDQKVYELIETEVELVNKKLASFETIKKFKILPSDFTIEANELTPSLKIKRKTIYERYKNLIEEMYMGKD